MIGCGRIRLAGAGKEIDDLSHTRRENSTSANGEEVQQGQHGTRYARREELLDVGVYQVSKSIKEPDKERYERKPDKMAYRKDAR